MKKVRIFIKSVRYSFGLAFRSGKSVLIFLFVLAVLTATLPILASLFLKQIIDFLTEAKENTNFLILYIALYIISLVCMQGINSAYKIAVDSVIQKSKCEHNLNVLRRIEKLPVSFIDSSKGRNIIDDVRHSEEAMVNLASRIIYVFSMTYKFCVALIPLARFNIIFVSVFLSLTIPGIILDHIFNKKTEALRLKTAPDVRKFLYYRWILTDSWPAKDVRTYDLTEPIKGRYDAERNAFRDANKALDKKKTASSIFSEIIIRCGEFAFIIYVIFEALKGDLSIGNVSFYISLSLTVISSFKSVISTITYWYGVTVRQAERMFYFFGSEHSYESDKSEKLGKFESLEFRDVYFKYPKTDKYVLSGVSFTLCRGDKLSIVGINGSGKTSIIKLMLGLYNADSGQILINGCPLSDYDIKDVRRMFSVLFQSFVQYPLTLRDNVALSDLRRKSHDQEIINALKKADIHDELSEKLSIGLDSYMTRRFDDRGTELSKGQWQKVALARAYFKNSEIIVFDEPSAALDAEAEDKIFKNYCSISDNRTCIMISHRISSSRISDKVIVLDKGKIVESGSHEQLLSLNGLYAKLFNMQKEKYTLGEDLQ